MVGSTAEQGVSEKRCPRCGYDLAGHVAAWVDRCPLESECPECGLVFRWRDVLVEDRRRLAWLFEHARAGWLGLGLVRSAAATAWMLVLPWVFWRRVRLHHNVVVRRLVLWAAVMMLGLHLLSSMLGLITAQLYLVRSSSGAWEWEAAWHLNVFTAPIVVWNNWGAWFLPGDGRREWVSAGVAFAVAWLVMVLVIPQTRARSKVHGGHLLRAGVYGVSWLGVLGLARVVDFGWLAVDALLVTQTAPSPLSGALLAPVGVFPLAVWTAMWWHAVLGRGWRVPRATLVWAVLMIPAVLAGVVAWCLVYVYGVERW